MGKLLQSNYWRESTRPLPSLVLIAPMILVYELGVAWLGAHADRNGVDVWLRSGLESLGMTHHFLLPILTCGLLVCWHQYQRESWSFQWTVITGMAIESAAFGLLLLATANAFAHFLQPSATFSPASPIMSLGAPRIWGKLVGYLGAGIYEELLFRLLLLPPAVAVLQRIGFQRMTSLIAASALTSIAFAAAHYDAQFTFAGQVIQWPGEAFNVVTFGFRTVAGGFFCLLFFTRGFGIAAAAHALYDIFVVVF